MARRGRWKPAAQGDLNRMRKRLAREEAGLEYKHDGAAEKGDVAGHEFHGNQWGGGGGGSEAGPKPGKFQQSMQPGDVGVIKDALSELAQSPGSSVDEEEAAHAANADIADKLSSGAPLTRPELATIADALSEYTDHPEFFDEAENDPSFQRAQALGVLASQRIQAIDSRKKSERGPRGRVEHALERKGGFSEDDHPRDEHGRFSSGGGGGSSSDSTKPKDEGWTPHTGPFVRGAEYRVATEGASLSVISFQGGGSFSYSTSSHGLSVGDTLVYDGTRSAGSDSPGEAYFKLKGTDVAGALEPNSYGSPMRGLLESRDDGKKKADAIDAFNVRQAIALVEFKKGNAGALLDYWGGEGDIGADGGFSRCVDSLSGKDDIDDPEALCAWLHHEVTGEWPGAKKGDEVDPEVKYEDDELTYKTMAAEPPGLSGLGFKVLDEEQGIVETIVSVTGVVDRVKDNILPGAYEKTLKTRTPKGVWSHDWDQPISKTLEAVELAPGDRRLPKTQRNGDAWPAEAGGLLIRTQFNLKTTQGRDAYENVVFFGEDQEWSIGYKVPLGKSKVDRKSGVREIEELDLFEYSPVLFGAMPLAATMDAKDEFGAGAATNGLGENAATAASVAAALLSHLDASAPDHDLIARAIGELSVFAQGGWSADAVVTLGMARAAASRLANATSGKLQRDALQASAAFGVMVMAVSAAQSVEDSTMKDAGEATDTKDIPSGASRNAPQGPAPGVQSVNPGSARGGSNTTSAAASSMAQGKTPDVETVPNGTNAAGSQAPAPDGGGLSNVRNGAPAQPSPGDTGRDRWNYAHQYRDDGQGRCERCGQSLGADLHTGWSPSSENRATGGEGPADSQTAQGDSRQPTATASPVPAGTDNRSITGNKRYDVGGVEAKIDVPMAGSWEEIQRSLRDQATVALRELDRTEDTEVTDDGGYGAVAMDDYVSLEGTWPDHVIACYYDSDSNPSQRYFSIPWMRDSTGDPMLGTPQEVDVTAVLTAKALEVLDEKDLDVSDIAAEVKAGRVVSDKNMQKLRAAHGHLKDVITAAEAKPYKKADDIDDPELEAMLLSRQALGVYAD